LGERYLYPGDNLIGIIGAEGSGKSTLIKGLFPGLELTNDDDSINNSPAPIFNFDENDYFSHHTFHIDVRYELAFRQLHEITDAVFKVIKANRRVIIEHFDLIYKQLGFNAQIIFGIGEEVKVYRPSVLGPSPFKIKEVADNNIKYRLMAHSAEDIVGQILAEEYGYVSERLHSDVRHGFIIGFDHKPDINLEEIENKVFDIINADIPITPIKGEYISIGEKPFFCTGKRIHVKHTGQIEHFRLMKEFKYDPISKQYLLVGLVGEEEIEVMGELPPVS